MSLFILFILFILFDMRAGTRPGLGKRGIGAPGHANVPCPRLRLDLLRIFFDFSARGFFRYTYV